MPKHRPKDAWDNWNEELTRLNNAWIREEARERQARHNREKLEQQIERLSMRMRINNRQRWLALYGPKDAITVDSKKLRGE